MTPEFWKCVTDLFDQARRLPPEERAALLDQQPADQRVREEVESLLGVYDEAPDFLEDSRPELPPMAEKPALAGRTIGRWRLLREIGRGGMGVVWEAERADGEFEHRAAIKLLSGGSFSESGVRRFREERRILALLEHPLIARLLDGGTAEDGTPYLVMEFVQGVPLDTWCEAERRSLRQRLELFLKICDAVGYAHRRLVIHRDLKPANVLVTSDGVPKLLDFGIARLLDIGEDGAPALKTEQILTPGFASPEQVRGEAAGVESDVYSLGVLLYLMLTGRRPYAESSSDPVSALRAVLEEDPAPPSMAASDAGCHLRGDLDAVVFCAMRKDADQRYPSVHAFATDIRAFLDGRPVQAHLEPRTRRALKFIRRNKAQSAAAALALFSLLGGTAVSLWQARKAERERARAETSFRELRQFSGSVLLELNDAIRNLPGSTPARLLLVRKATEMLDNLARGGAGDSALQLELAKSYRQLSRLQGARMSDNVGQSETAIASLRIAVQLAESATSARPTDSQSAITLLNCYAELRNLLLDVGQIPEADSTNVKHRAIIERIKERPRPDVQAQADLASAYVDQGYYSLQRGSLVDADACYRRAVGVFEVLANAGKATPAMNDQYSLALKRLGALLIRNKAYAEAETYYRRALAIEDTEIAAKPGDKSLKVYRTITLSDIGMVRKNLADIQGAAGIYEEVLAVRRAGLRDDPDNQRFLNLTSSTEQKLAGVYTIAGRHEKAMELARAAVRHCEESKATAHDRQISLAGARVALARTALSAARPLWVKEAQPQLHQSEAFLKSLDSTKVPLVIHDLLLEFEIVSSELRRFPTPQKSLSLF